jgi:hypothetical protein
MTKLTNIVVLQSLARVMPGQLFNTIFELVCGPDGDQDMAERLLRNEVRLYFKRMPSWIGRVVAMATESGNPEGFCWFAGAELGRGLGWREAVSVATTKIDKHCLSIDKYR